MTSIQPELWVDSPRDALRFYEAAFGATVLHRVGAGDDIVAQLGVGEAAFWVAPASSTMKRLSPRSIEGATGRTLLVVNDPETVVRQAVAAGATETSPVGDEHGWRLGRIIDPAGHEWEIGVPLGKVTTSPANAQRTPVQPADLVAAAGYVRSALRPLIGVDWSAAAGELDWTARQTLEHLPNTLTWYAAQLATRARGDLPGPRHGDPSLSVADLLTVTVSTAAVLGEVVAAAKPGARAFHPAGAADPEGWAAMGCDELLIHGDDIALGLGGSFHPPAELCERVLRRLFPWAPEGVGPWEGLRWANGRAPLDSHERLGPDWVWHCAPLDTWDGTVPRWQGPSLPRLG